MSNSEARARAANAYRALDHAESNCVHWDYQSDGYPNHEHDCCMALLAAKERYQAARDELRRSRER